MNHAKKLCSVVLLLCGCASQPQPEPLRDIVLVPEKTKVNLPEETLRECSPLPRLEERYYTQVEFLEAFSPIVAAASDCRRRKRDLTHSVREAFNIGEAK